MPRRVGRDDGDGVPAGPRGRDGCSGRPAPPDAPQRAVGEVPRPCVAEELLDGHPRETWVRQVEVSIERCEPGDLRQERCILIEGVEGPCESEGVDGGEDLEEHEPLGGRRSRQDLEPAEGTPERRGRPGLVIVQVGRLQGRAEGAQCRDDALTQGPVVER